MTYLEAMKQALEALVKARKEMDALPHSLGYSFDHLPAYDEAITNLRTAIEEIMQAEPVAWVYEDYDQEPEISWGSEEPYKEAASITGIHNWTPLYTHPAPLTVPENLDEIAVGLAKELAQMSQDMGLYEPAPPSAGLDVDCKNCAHRGMIYGTSQDIYCEFCKHKAHTLKDYYKPKNTAPQSPTEPYHLTKEEHEIVHEALRGSSAPAGAAPLPDEVVEMVEKLRWMATDSIGAAAATMLERLARDAAHWKYQADEAEMMRVHYGQQIDQLRARIAELEKQHEGWQWVPKELTNEMMIAAHHVDNKMHLYQYWQDAWRALLSAAPAPPEQGEG